MNVRPITGPRPRSSARLRNLQQRLLNRSNARLNIIFGLTRRDALRRCVLVFILFLLTWFGFALYTYPLEWQSYIRNVFTILFSGDVGQILSAVTAFVRFAITSLVSPSVLRHIWVLLIPFLLAWYLAAIYLTDIFELEKEGSAWSFIGQAAFAIPGYHKITIKEGDVAEGDRQSPIVLIGGPGLVQINLDSVALFEKANGEPRVIGPTERGPVALNGFERLRQVIDLRDQIPSAIPIHNRTRDGIRIGAQDVRMVFNIDRGSAAPTLQNPHPFNLQAVHSLVYQQIAIVTPGQTIKQALPPWNVMLGLVREELSDFMAECTLGEFLANIGEPELRRLDQAEEHLKRLVKQFAPGMTVPPIKSSGPPSFISRSQITGRFYNPDFTKRARNRGVELGWIGIGTWELSTSIVLENHIEAWRITRENLMRGSEQVLKDLEQEASLQELLRLIQDVPLSIFRQRTQDKASANRIMRELLVAYHKQLKAAQELYWTRKVPVPNTLAAAIHHFEAIIPNIPYWV